MRWGDMRQGYWKDSADDWAVMKITEDTGATWYPGKGQAFWNDYHEEEGMSDSLVFLGEVPRGLC